MNLFEILAYFISGHSILVSFLGGFFGGEEIIITLSFLSANGLIPLWVVFVFCFLGTFLCDFTFFMLGKWEKLNYFKKYRFIRRNYKKAKELFSKVTKDSLALSFFYARFIIGMKSFSLFFIGRKKVSLRRFILSDFIAIFIWMSIIVFIGFFAGSWFKIILNLFKSIQLAIAGLVLFGLVVYFARKYFIKRLS